MPTIRATAIFVLMLLLATVSGCGWSALKGEFWTKQYTSEPGEYR